MAAHTKKPAIHGLLAEFDKPEAIVETARQARAEGFTKVEAFSPMPIHALDDAMGLKNKLPLVVLLGGLTGMAVGIVVLFVAWETGAVAWTWFAFIGAAVTAGVSLIASLGLDPPPSPAGHHA